MIRHLLSTLFLTCLISFLAAAQVNLNLGLKAYYPFSGNATDASGNGNDAVFNNATLTTDRFGNANSAYHFDGSSSYIQVPNHPTLNFGNTISLVAWVRTTGFYTGNCHGNSVLMKGDDANFNGRYVIRYDDGPFLSGNNCTGSAPDIMHENYWGTGAFPMGGYTPYVTPNQWVLVVYTYDGTNAKIYLNCNLVVNQVSPGYTFTNPYDLFIGKANSGMPSFPYWFNGDEDDVRIYDRALTDDEVKVLGGCPIPASSCSNWLLTPTLGSCVTAGDLDVSGNQLTVEATFNRTSTANSTGGYGFLVSKHTGPGNINYCLWPDGCAITTVTGGDNIILENCTIKLNKTYHVAMVYDGVTLKFYRNGFLHSQKAVSGNLFNNDFPLTIGQNSGVGYPEINQFLGDINEVRIWNIARTQSEIRSNMSTALPSPTTQTGLVGYYFFDDLINKQGNATYNGTLVGSASINATNGNCTFLADSCITRTTISNVINEYTPVLALEPCNNKLTLEDATKFKVGDTVLIIQMKGAIIDSTNTAAFGDVSDYKNAGNYEFNYVKGKNGNTLDLKNVLTRQYDIPNGKVQLVRVPFYDNTTISATLTCLPWDGGKGGVLVLNALDNITLNANIDVTGKGFKGGLDPFTNPPGYNCYENNFFYPVNPDLASGKGEGVALISAAKSFGKGKLANGGGGGNSHNAGGGGGSNGALGGFGGYNFEGTPCNTTVPFDNRGIGGGSLPYNNATNKIFLGGGGGAGHTNNPEQFKALGGDGGGIAIIMANSLNSNGKKILANGNPGVPCTGTNSGCHEGMGGGGSGGTVLLNINSYVDLSSVQLIGGKGGDMSAVGLQRLGPGGGGSGGILWVNNSALPANLSATATGGASGVCIAYTGDQWGATAGANGTNLVSLQIPIDNISFKANIDSVRAKSTATSCSAFDFQGLAYFNTSPIATWQWSFGDNATDNSQNPSHTYAASGFYVVKLIATDINGCKDSVIINLNVQGKPVITKTPDTDVCLGSTTQLQVGGGTIFSWTSDPTLSSTGIANPTSTQVVPGIITYYFTVTNASGCSNNDSIKLNAHAKPVITKSALPATVCVGSSSQLQVGGGTIYTWTPDVTLSNIAIANPLATPLVSGVSTYYFTVKDANNCVNNDSLKISVNPKPAITKSADASICAGSTTQLQVGGGTTYSWQPDPTLSNIGIPNPVASPTGPGTFTYSFTVTDANTCSASGSIKVTVSPKPVITKSADANVCLGGASQLQVGGGTIYSWTPDPTLSNTGISNPISTPTVPGLITYYFTVTNANNCFNNDSIKITSRAKPVITKSAGTIICAGSTTQLQVAGGIIYSWTPDPTLNNTGISNPIAAPINAGTTTYYFTVTDAFTCTNNDSIKISLFPKAIITKSTDPLICIGNNTQLAINGGTAYTWSPVTGLNDPSSSTPIANPVTTTMYYVAIKDANSCDYLDSIKVSVRPPETFGINAPVEMCLYKSVTLGATGGDTYNWQSQSSLDQLDIANPVASPLITTLYTVTVTDTVCHLSNDLSTTVTVLPLPLVHATKTNDIDCSTSISQLNATGAIQYSWSPIGTLKYPLTASPVASPTSSTLYTVTGKDSKGCVNQDTLTIKVIAAGQGNYLMPTGFTPNNDGINDCYGVKYWGSIIDLDFSIFNRWGERVFHTTTPGDCWNGIYKGIPQNSDVYVYMIKAKTICADNVFRKGTFALIR